MSAGAGLALGLAMLLGGAKESLEMRLTRMDDASMRLGAAQALNRGVKVRLILSPREKSSRLLAPTLHGPGLQLRWSARDGASFIVVDEQRVILGGFARWEASLDECGEGVEDTDPAAALEACSRFESEWEGLGGTLPEGVILKDELEALPDPRENQPRLQTKRRKN